MITVRNLARHELIGLEVEVIGSVCKEYCGLKGTVVDETKNTIVIEINGREKIVPKKVAKFRFAIHTPQGAKQLVEIEGSKLAYRPEDRIKKLG